MRLSLSLLGSLIGVALFIAGMVVLSAQPPEADEGPVKTAVVTAMKKAPPKERKRPRAKAKPRARPRPRARAPVPNQALTSAGLSVSTKNATLGLEDGLEVEGDVVMTAETVDTAPRAKSRKSPEYPRSARRAGTEGQVQLNLLISASGTVDDARLLSATPSGVFEDAALEAVRRWTFSPARYEGRAVSVWARQTIDFRLSGAGG